MKTIQEIADRLIRSFNQSDLEQIVEAAQAQAACQRLGIKPDKITPVYAAEIAAVLMGASAVPLDPFSMKYALDSLKQDLDCLLECEYQKLEDFESFQQEVA